MYRACIKPLIDFILALAGLILLSPVFVLITILLLFVNHGKPFFFQGRPGMNNRVFNVIKFKTMNDKKDENDQLLPDGDRLTFVGRFIRRTSLDEIPQLLNIIKGDMSLVGPRPLLIDYLPLYNDQQKRRHDIRPGITGWAQVNGRNGIGWNKKFEYDIWYIQHISFFLDLKILWMTMIKVFKSEGISSASSTTMEKFSGN